MPQATEEQRRKWGTNGSAGHEKAISFLESRGYKLTSSWQWERPLSQDITDEDIEAAQFLVDEWDFGWFTESTSAIL